MSLPMRAKKKREWRPQRDWGRVLAVVLSIAFGLVGAVPLTLGVLVRTEVVRRWAAERTAEILSGELGLTARYRVEVQAWPLLVALNDVTVDASDGGGPFLEVERVSVRPRPFSLLAGDIDAGDIELVGPRVRAVVAAGEIKNLTLKPQAPSSKSKAPSTRAPFASIAITDAGLDVTVDGVRATTEALDVDVASDEAGGFEIALRAGGATVTRQHPMPGREATEDSVDEDRVCRLDARVRVEEGSVLVRRLSLEAVADLDPDPRTRPRCELPSDDWRTVDVKLSALRVRLPTDHAPLSVAGRVHAKLPVGIAHRFASLAHASGSVTLDLDADYDGVRKLPSVVGSFSADMPGIDGKVFSQHVEAKVSTATGAVEVTNLRAKWAEGDVTIAAARIDPFAEGTPLSAGPIDIKNAELHGLLRDLGVHPRAHVHWSLKEIHFDRFGGKLSPLALDGMMAVKSTDFEITDKAVIDPSRSHMFGVKEALVHGNFRVTPEAVILQGYQIDTPRSHVSATVQLGFASWIDLDVGEAKIDLSETSPLIEIPTAGVATIKARMRGPFDHPKLEGDLAVTSFMFGGFPIGDIESAKVGFEPLAIALSDAHIRHGQSRVTATDARIAFDKGADVLVDAEIDTRAEPHLDVRDFFEVFHFDKDPRFEDIHGSASGKAKLHYALGGKEDRCGGGFMDVRAQMDMRRIDLFGERYDDGSLDLGFVWDDQLAGDAGMVIDVYSGVLRKGSGSVLAQATVRHGGVLRGSAVATGLPLDSLDVLGKLGKAADGSVSFVAELGGFVSDVEAHADVNVSRVRLGAATLPPSRMSLAMERGGPSRRSLGKTRCGNERAGVFDLAEFERDLPAGQFRVNGALFDDQVRLHDVTITRQKHKTMRGAIDLEKLDLGTIANAIPGVALVGPAPTGKLSANVVVKNLPFDAPKRAEVSIALKQLDVERAGSTVKLANAAGNVPSIKLSGDQLDVPDLRLALTSGGLGVTLIAAGKVKSVMTAPDLDLDVRVEPIDLSRLGSTVEGVERASGTLDATLKLAGPIDTLRTTGAAHVRKGSLGFKGSPLGLDDMEVEVDVGGGELRIKNATARVGGGQVEMRGRMPIKGTDLGTLTASIVARGVRMPVADGINLTADAELEATYRPGAPTPAGEKNLPDLKGTVSLTQFSYTRPIALSLSLGSIGRPQRTQVDTYDPNDDVVRFHLNVVSPRPLRFTNNLVDMQLEVVEPGLALSGTNQRFGARGILRILPDSKLTLRSNEFDMKEGFVRFDDPSAIKPKVDLRAQTEYRRYAAAQDTSAGVTPSEGQTPGAASGPAASTQQSGLWRITLRMHGDLDDLKVTLASDPPLSQEDIVLLLTLGMTRAEIDRSASNLGESVGLEALSALTGADKAVKSVVPIIDEFRFGSGYSSKTARMEPTVTIGKRLSDSVRASVTTGITENREVRSNLEWRLGRRTSLQGSYDNANDVSSSLLGNIGLDLRWHLEFE
jgi:translocation and assembly module TamB